MTARGEMRRQLYDARRGRKLPKRLADMAVGDSIFEIGVARNIQHKVSRYAGNYLMRGELRKPRFRAFAQELGGEIGVMIWRYD